MESHADPRNAVVAGHADLAKVMAEGDRARTGMLWRVLRELQRDARDVFACSGETVDGFLRDRQHEARQAFDVPA